MINKNQTWIWFFMICMLLISTGGVSIDASFCSEIRGEFDACYYLADCSWSTANDSQC